MNATTWRDQLKLTIQRHARVLSGCAVAFAVTDATDAVWELGLDAAYHELVKEIGVTEENAEAFHDAWLVVFALKLYERTPQ